MWVGPYLIGLFRLIGPTLSTYQLSYAIISHRRRGPDRGLQQPASCENRP